MDKDKAKDQPVDEIAELGHQIAELDISEGELRNSSELYRQVVEDSPNPVFSIDKSGIIQSWGICQ